MKKTTCLSLYEYRVSFKNVFTMWNRSFLIKKNGKITKEYTQANIIAKQYGPFIKTNSPNNCHTPLLNSMIYRNSFKYP